MDELHWTGAALLLAVAVLGGGANRPRHQTIVTWDEFAREHRIALDEKPTVSGRLLAEQAERVRDRVPTALSKRRRGQPRRLPIREAS